MFQNLFRRQLQKLAFCANNIAHATKQPLLILPSAFPAFQQSQQQSQQQSIVPFSADSQQRTLLSQLLSKYGRDSDEVKEFALTTADLSPTDEIRMLSPCGQHYTNSIFYQILYLRFQLNEADEPSREHARHYERCLISETDEELHFWDKVREMSQISAGFVQGIKDQHDSQIKEEERSKRSTEVQSVAAEAEELKALATSSKLHL